MQRAIRISLTRVLRAVECSCCGELDFVELGREPTARDLGETSAGYIFCKYVYCFSRRSALHPMSVTLIVIDV